MRTLPSASAICPDGGSFDDYFVGVAPLITVSGSTSVDTPARTMISRSASAVGTWNLKFMPRCTPTAIRSGVQPDTLFLFQISTSRRWRRAA